VTGNAWKETVEEGKEGNYGLDGVVLVGTNRTYPCRTHYGLHNGMLPEAIKAKERELEWIPFTLSFFFSPLKS
jgi:hypothetical protein